MPAATGVFDAIVIGGSEWCASARGLATQRQIRVVGYQDSIAGLSAHVWLLDWPEAVGTAQFQSLRDNLKQLREGRIFAFCGTTPKADDHSLAGTLTVPVQFESKPAQGLTESLLENCLRQAIPPEPRAPSPFEETGTEPAIFLDHVVKFLDERKTKSAPTVQSLSECHDALDRHFLSRITAVNELRSRLEKRQPLTPNNAVVGWVLAACLETELLYQQRGGRSNSDFSLPDIPAADLKASIPEEILLSLTTILVGAQPILRHPEIVTLAQSRRCELKFAAVPSFVLQPNGDPKIATSVSALLAQFGSTLEFDLSSGVTTLRLPVP